MNPLAYALVASAVLAAFLADARQLCGKSLVKHVGDTCGHVECDFLQDVGTKKKSYSDLVLECCSQGCSRSVIERYCCAKVLDVQGDVERSEPKPVTNFEVEGVLII